MAARKTSADASTDTTTTAEGTEPEATTPESAPAEATTEPTVSADVVAAAGETSVEPSSESTELPESTTLDSDNTKPSVTAPGDGPADTTDPRELASSAPFYPGPEALAAGTVNAVQKVGEVSDPAEGRDDADDRIETYETTNPKGERVTVRHNLETGATSVTAAE